MSPAILPDDPVHVDRWVFFGRDPRPGEVVELSPKNETARPIVPLGGALRTAALPVTRRIIAVPGDTVAGHGRADHGEWCALAARGACRMSFRRGAARAGRDVSRRCR